MALIRNRKLLAGKACLVLTTVILAGLFHSIHLFEFVYHYDGIAYDYYSENDLQRLYIGDQWRLWPLPQDVQTVSISPFAQSKLLFVDVIYIMTNPRLITRHRHLQKVFRRQGLSMESVQCRMKWNYTTCNSADTHTYVYQRLNLKDKPLNRKEQRRCAITMEHVDVWYEIVERKVPLALILEDDVLFVPFFKEKFTRMIATALRRGELRIGGTCAAANNRSTSSDERINQDPMIVIGNCFHFHGKGFHKNLSNASPQLSTQKSDPSRCTHAYLLTSCSARALIEQIQKQKNDFWPSDFLQNHLFPLSPTLQSFWMDPPLAYQGNQVIDIDQIETFRTQTYK